MSEINCYIYSDKVEVEDWECIFHYSEDDDDYEDKVMKKCYKTVIIYDTDDEILDDIIVEEDGEEKCFHTAALFNCLENLKDRKEKVNIYIDDYLWCSKPLNKQVKNDFKVKKENRQSMESNHSLELEIDELLEEMQNVSIFFASNVEEMIPE